MKFIREKGDNKQLELLFHQLEELPKTPFPRKSFKELHPYYYLPRIVVKDPIFGKCFITSIEETPWNAEVTCFDEQEHLTVSSTMTAGYRNTLIKLLRDENLRKQSNLSLDKIKKALLYVDSEWEKAMAED